MGMPDFVHQGSTSRPAGVTSPAGGARGSGEGAWRGGTAAGTSQDPAAPTASRPVAQPPAHGACSAV
jgi:hypothetical protein